MSDSVRPHRRQPTRFPVPGILQARILEWVAISFSKAWKWKVKVKSLSRVWLLVTPWTAAYQDPPSMGFSSQEYWSGVPLPSPDQTLLTIKRYFNPQDNGPSHKMINPSPCFLQFFFSMPFYNIYMLRFMSTVYLLDMFPHYIIRGLRDQERWVTEGSIQ